MEGGHTTSFWDGFPGEGSYFSNLDKIVLLSAIGLNFLTKWPYILFCVTIYLLIIKIKYLYSAQSIKNCSRALYKHVHLHIKRHTIFTFLCFTFLFYLITYRLLCLE